MKDGVGHSSSIPLAGIVTLTAPAFLLPFSDALLIQLSPI